MKPTFPLSDASTPEEIEANLDYIRKYKKRINKAIQNIEKRISMNTPWINSYPKNISPKISLKDDDRTIIDLFNDSVKNYKNLPAFTNMGKTITYSELDELSQRFASYLRHELHLKKGDRVAIMMPNLLQYPIAMFGILRAGLVVVNVNPLYTSRELKHQLQDSGAKAIVVLENFAHVLAEIIEDTSVEVTITTKLGDMLPFGKRHLVNFVVKNIKNMVPDFELDSINFKNALNIGRRHDFLQPILHKDNFAFFQYTGGTTGVAKGAVLTHHNLVANVEQAHAWVSSVLKDGEEIVITALPLYHIFSLMANCLMFMKIGGLNHLITNPRDLKGFVNELQKTRFTAFTGVNTLFNGLMHTPGFDKIDFSKLKLTLGGGMAVQRAVADEWEQRTGSTLLEAYGLTEASPAVCINPLTLKEYNGKIGLPIPSTEVCIKDDNGNNLPIGTAGELCVRGPQIMKGYWNLPEETDKVIKDGWLHTGDVAYIDEQGYVEIVDRKKDMINVSGFNVYPNEIEEVMMSHPNVVEVGVVGIPHNKTGEAVKAVVVVKGNVTKAELRDYCKTQLTNYKVPTHIEFVDTLPKTAVGKILRRELK